MFIVVMLFLFISIPVYALIRMIQSFSKRKKPQKTKGGTARKTRVDIVYSIFIYCLLLLGFYINSIGENAGEPLVIFEMNVVKANGYASLANAHIFSIVSFK